MLPVSMILSDVKPRFQGHDIIQRQLTKTVQDRAIFRVADPVASLARGIGGDGHGSRAACHGSLLESGKNNAQKFA